MRATRIAGYVAIGLGIAVVLLVSGVLVLTRTDWGRDRVRQFALDGVAESIDGSVEIVRIEGNLLRGVRLIGVAIRDEQNRPFVEADTLALRFALRGLLRQRLELTDVRVVHATIVLDRPPGEEWNYVRIFRMDDPDVVQPGEPGWGDWVALSDVEVVGSRVTVRTAWQPAEDLTPAEQQEALRRALEGDSREHVVAVPGGHQNVMDFRELNAELPRVLIAHPDTAGIPFEVAHLSGLVRPFSPPPARVDELSGEFRIVRDSLLMQNVHAVLTDTRLSGGGSYALHSGDLLLSVRGEPVAFSDLRWIYPPLPEQGGGTMQLTLELGAVTNRVAVRDLDATIGDATIAGSFDLTTGDTLRFGDTDLRFERIPTAVVERFVDFDAPRSGLLSGTLAVAGLPRALRVDGDVRFHDDAGGVSRVVAEGELGVDPSLRFSDLRLRFTPLQAQLARAIAPTLPLRGTVEGTAVLSGSPASFAIDADLVLRDPRHGISRIHATGGIATTGPVQLRELVVRLNPLRAGLAREWAPDLQLGGVLTGTATLNGSTASGIAVRGDIVHDEAGERSRVIGSAAVPLAAGGRALVDVQLQPLALRVAGLFVPAAGLHGSVAGRLHAEGDLADLRVDADLETADGGRLNVTGTLNVAAAEPAYDLDVGLTQFDFAAVTRHAPAPTDLSGTVVTRGRGFEPATMRTTLTADLSDSSVDDVATDRVKLRVEVADGVAAVDSSVIRIDGANATFDGSFGLVEQRDGVLRYSVVIDSLHTLAAWLPGADTAVGRALPPVPSRVARSALEEVPDAAVDTVDRSVTQRAPAARSYVAADGARVTVTTTRVQKAIERDEPTPARLTPAGAVTAHAAERTAPDTARAAFDTVTVAATTAAVDLPADSVAGSVNAEGSIRGNLIDFGIAGRVAVEDLIYRASYVGRGNAEYELADLRTPAPDITAVVDLRDVRAMDMSFDTVALRGHYRGVRNDGVGELVIAAQASDDTEYGAEVEFTLSLPRNELRIADLSLRFDTITWRTAQPGAVNWAGDAVELASIDLVSDAGGRVMLDGRLPADGTGDLDVLIEQVSLAQIATLLQLDTRAEGRLNLNAHVEGTLASPRLRGDASLDDVRLDDEEVPTVRTSFEYADRLLVADAQLLHDQRQIAVAEARLPLDLSLLPDIAPRLLDGELTIDVRADSLPVEAVPAIAAQIQDVRGHVRGQLTVRGTFDAPVLAGAAELDLGSIHIVPINVRFDSVRGRLAMADNTVRVDSLFARSGGDIRMSGEIDVATLTMPAFDLVVDAREALIVNTDDVRLHVDADITVGGTLEQIVIGGEVRTRRGVIWIPTLDELGAVNVVGLHAPTTYARFDTAFLDERLALARQRPLLERMQLDIAVVIDRDVWLRSTEANVEIYTPRQAGPLRIRMSGAEVGFSLEGAVNTDRGEYEFMSRRFALTRGAATFTGEPDINPILQIAAQHEVRMPGREAFDIRVLLGGTMREVEITLESTAQPPIAQTDLLSYLALGRDASGLLQRQGSALSGQGGEAGELVGNVAGLATHQLGTIALDVLVSDLEAQLIRDFGLDVFRITPADLPPDMFTGSYLDVLRSTEIEAGRYVSPRLFVAGQLASSLSRPGVRVEYTTPFGMQWTTSWVARWLPSEPTLTDRDPRRASVLGSFLSREWRF